MPPKRKRVVKKRKVRVRCAWCGREFSPVASKEGKRIPSHKADRDWEYRDDDRCPGSRALLKRLAPQAVTTHPQAMKDKRKKTVKKRG